MRKMVFLWMVLLTAFLWTSCKIVYFEQPQPVNVRNLNSFPKSMRGVWLSNGSDTVLISAHEIKVFQYEEFNLDVHSLERLGGSIRNNKLFFKPDSVVSYTFSLRNDTIIYRIPQVQRFVISDTMLVKPLGRNLIMNSRTEGHWALLLAIPHRDVIEFKSLNEDDLTLLKTLVPVHIKKKEGKDDIYCQADVSRKTMKLFVRRGGFSERYALVRRLNN
jgi:hypothetical protein